MADLAASMKSDVEQSYEDTSADEMLPIRSSAPIRLTYVLPCAMIVCLMFLSFLPTDAKLALHTMGPFHLAGHVLCFAVVSFALSRTTRSTGTWFVALLVMLVLGGTLEGIQHLVYPGEALEWNDVVCDTVGTVCGALAAWPRARVLPRQDYPSK